MDDFLAALNAALAHGPSADVAQLLSLALPVLALCLLVVLLLLARARRRRNAAQQNGSVPEALYGASLESPGLKDQRLEEGEAAKIETRGAKPQPSVDPVTAIATLKVELKSAMLSQPKTALAPIYLELARQCFAAGDETGYLEALRSAAGVASLHGPLEVHAEVRLELAEAALRAGDTIGACEHWQMARVAFEECGQRDAQDRVDQQMRANGCPTDWVLTDF